MSLIFKRGYDFVTNVWQLYTTIHKFSNLLLKYIGIYVIIRKYGRINKKNYIIEN